MRILYLISAYARGEGSSALHVDCVEALGRVGHQVTVCTLDPRSRGGPFLRESHEGGESVVRIACSRSLRERALNSLSLRVFRYPFFLNALKGYRRLIRERSFDVVHVETAFPMGGVTTFPGVPRVPQVVTPQGEDLIVEQDYDYGHRRFAVVRRLVARSLSRAEVVRCISPLVAELVPEAGGTRANCISVPCNVRSDAIPPDVASFREQARAALRSALRAGRDEPLLLAFGRLHPFKGLDAMIRALGVLYREGQSFSAVICGGVKHTPRFENYRDHLARLVEEEGLGERVRFHDEIASDEAGRMLAAADLVVVPSTTESFNRVTIEAAAVGTPVVVTRSTGISGYLDGEPWAVVAESREAKPLAADIRRGLLLADAALTRGPAFARRFLPDLVVQEMIPLYQRAMELFRERRP